MDVTEEIQRDRARRERQMQAAQRENDYARRDWREQLTGDPSAIERLRNDRLARDQHKANADVAQADAQSLYRSTNDRPVGDGVRVGPEIDRHYQPVHSGAGWSAGGSVRFGHGPQVGQTGLPGYALAGGSGKVGTSDPWRQPLGVDTIEAVAPVPTLDPGGLSRHLWRHRKTGKVYRIQCLAVDEATLCPVVVYRGEDLGDVWVRLAAEFFDGRFEQVSL